ncbi:hypothetical protein NC653_028354 [Populus alba x Populus x berolinensis]|uniref:Uncharacterized protein n=1 Tax=Populus alba x Populus x berolinensis TaxID=444605 RepID=A0AAD6Q669_9ROSI|nr:hypothetical protein NC653_028354 [Populus alba x Populus x berolinensis]
MTLQIEETVPNPSIRTTILYLHTTLAIQMDVPEFSLIHLVFDFRTCIFFNPGNCRPFTSAPEECSSDRFLSRNLMRVCATLVGLGQTTEGLFFNILLQRFWISLTYQNEKSHCASFKLNFFLAEHSK